MKKEIFNEQSQMNFLNEQDNIEVKSSNELVSFESNLKFIIDLINNTYNSQLDKILIEEKKKYYVPTCRWTGCEGSLTISINENNFTINCICDKNKNHKFDNLILETFEKFYLKENIIQNCFKCYNNLECKDKYKCNECEKIYCTSCFISDVHIKKNLHNLKIISNKCSKDQRELTYYCLDCRKKVCLFVKPNMILQRKIFIKIIQLKIFWNK